MSTRTVTLTNVRCNDGGLFRRDANGRAVCEACKSVVTFESLLAVGISPMWTGAGLLVTNAAAR